MQPEEQIMINQEIKEAIKKYKSQISHSKTRGIPFKLSFEEWYIIWTLSGHWHERGKGRDKYVMSRYSDKGAYEVGNVFIQSNSKNVIDAQKGRKQTPLSNLKRHLTLKGRKQSPEWIAKRIKKTRGPYKKRIV